MRKQHFRSRLIPSITCFLVPHQPPYPLPTPPHTHAHAHAHVHAHAYLFFSRFSAYAGHSISQAGSRAPPSLQLVLMHVLAVQALPLSLQHQGTATPSPTAPISSTLLAARGRYEVRRVEPPHLDSPTEEPVLRSPCWGARAEEPGAVFRTERLSRPTPAHCLTVPCRPRDMSRASPIAAYCGGTNCRPMICGLRTAKSATPRPVFTTSDARSERASPCLATPAQLTCVSPAQCTVDTCKHPTSHPTLEPAATCCRIHLPFVSL